MPTHAAWLSVFAWRVRFDDELGVAQGICGRAGCVGSSDSLAVNFSCNGQAGCNGEPKLGVGRELYTNECCVAGERRGLEYFEGSEFFFGESDFWF